jgi:hypothetical protein
VFTWAIPEISGNGEQRRFRAASTKSQSPTTPMTPSDAVRNTCSIAFGVLGQLVEILPRYEMFWTDEVMQVLLTYSTIDPFDGEFSPMALNVIIDLLEKGQLPPSSSRYLPNLFAKVQDIVTYNLTSEVDDEYDITKHRFKEKSISLASAFLSIHLPRAAKFNPELVQPTLNLFAKFTLKQDDEDSLNLCIETWEIMIENGICKDHNDSLQSTFQTLADQLYEEKVLERGSIKALDLIGRICSTYPQEVFTLFVQKFDLVSNRFLQQQISQNGIEELNGISNVLGRIIAQFETPFLDRFLVAKSVLIQHIEILAFLESSILPQNQEFLLLNLTTSVFNNLSAFLAWLVNYQNATIENELEENNYLQLVTRLVDFTFKWQESNSCSHWGSSSKFLSRCIEELRPDVLYSDITARSLNNLIVNRNLPFTVCVNMWNVASTLHLVVPYGKRLSKSDWDTKSADFKSFVNPILQELDQVFTIDMSTHPNPHEVRMEIIYVFIVIKSIA